MCRARTLCQPRRLPTERHCLFLAAIPPEPLWIDQENFNRGDRGMHLLPKRGDKPEWQHTQDYWSEKDEFPAADLEDGAFLYE